MIEFYTPTQLFMECAPGKCPSLARTKPEGEEEQEGEEGPRLCSNTAIQARRFPPTEVFKVRRQSVAHHPRRGIK